MRVPKIRQATAADQVREALLKRIDSGELAVGAKLPTEAELAVAFGVSRAVIREALGSARATGVLRSHRGRGTFVASGRPQNLLLLGRYQTGDLHEVRCDLEIPGAAQAAGHRSDEDVERLTALIAEMDEEQDLERWVGLDAAFHVAIARAGGNSVRIRLIEDLRDLLVVFSLAATDVEGRKASAAAEHREICHAICAADPAGAQTAMERHLNGVTQMLGVVSPARSGDVTEQAKGAT